MSNGKLMLCVGQKQCSKTTPALANHFVQDKGDTEKTRLPSIHDSVRAKGDVGRKLLVSSNYLCGPRKMRAVHATIHYLCGQFTPTSVEKCVDASTYASGP